MARTIFVTATDTGAGKTWVTAHLLQQMLAKHVKAQALKPIASGVLQSGINEDVTVLLRGQHKLVEDINFHTYARPVAPALAAQGEGRALVAQDLMSWLQRREADADVTLVEGVGGLMVPLVAGAQQQPWLVKDWLQTMPSAEVLLVVPLRLGCMNHTLLNCMLLAQLNRVPKWIVLNDLEQNESGEETRKILLPCLAQIFDKMPMVLCVQKAEDLFAIV